MTEILMTICLYQQLSGQRVLAHVTKLNQNIDKCKNSGNNSTFLQKSNKTQLLNLSHPFMCYVPVQSKVLDPPSFSLQMLTTWLVSTCGVVVVLFIGSQRLKKKNYDWGQSEKFTNSFDLLSCCCTAWELSSQYRKRYVVAGWGHWVRWGSLYILHDR